MIKTKQQLNALRYEAEKGRLSILDIQQQLSGLILSNNEIHNMEEIAKEFDNKMELVIYTLNTENQLGAAISIIDEALKYVNHSMVSQGD